MRARWGVKLLGWSTLVAAVVVLLAVSRCPGQSVYRWKDERGVLHFSDTPPPGRTDVELHQLPPPAVHAEIPPTIAPTASGDQAQGTPAAEGPARVEITDQDDSVVGDSSHEYKGKVKNAGGEPAQDVVVVITVTETQQGAECLSQDVPVEPSTLGPGDEGSWSARFDNPCYFGPTTASVRPDWR